MDLDYNVTYREKDKGLQVIISYKVNRKWKQKSKQGFENSRQGKKEAKTWVQETIEELNSGINLNNEYSDTTFKNFIELYMNDRKSSIAESTLILFNSAYKCNFTDLDNIKLRDITPMDIQRCVNKMSERGLHSSTISRYITNLKTMFNYAIHKYKILNYNPAVDIEIKRTYSEEKRALSIEESNILLKKLSELRSKQYYIASLIAVRCGLRIGEICGLTWKDIDLTNKELEVNKQWKKKNGVYQFLPPKSQNSFRKVPFDSFVKNELIKYRDSSSINLDNRIIKRINTDGFSSDLIGIYKSVNFDISIHELRHTYATNLIANGMDFKTAAKLLGHNVEQTMKTYSHVNSDMMHRAKAIIENIF